MILENPELNIPYQRLSFETYRTAPGISQGKLRLLRRSPAHLKASLDGLIEDKDTKEKRFGAAFHAALLEAERFKDCYTIEPDVDRRTKSGKEEYQRWKDDLKPDAIVVPKEFVDHLPGMMESIARHPFTKNLMKHGKREVSWWWQDEETGELCKGRADFISDLGYAVDIKTTRDAHPRAFAKELFNDDRFMALQAAHYTNGGRISKLFKENSFTFVAIEKVPPYAISINTMDQVSARTEMDLPSLLIAEAWRSNLMRTYKKCKDSGAWPSYSERAQAVIAPGWVDLPPEENQ